MDCIPEDFDHFRKSQKRAQVGPPILAARLQNPNRERHPDDGKVDDLNPGGLYESEKSHFITTKQFRRLIILRRFSTNLRENVALNTWPRLRLV